MSNKLSNNKGPSKEASISLRRENQIVIASTWREVTWKRGGIRCGEGQEKCPDGHANEWKSAADRGEVVVDISRMIPGQGQGRCSRINGGDLSCDSLHWEYGT